MHLENARSHTFGTSNRFKLGGKGLNWSGPRRWERRFGTRWQIVHGKEFHWSKCERRRTNKTSDRRESLATKSPTCICRAIHIPRSFRRCLRKRVKTFGSQVFRKLKLNSRNMRTEMLRSKVIDAKSSETKEERYCSRFNPSLDNLSNYRTLQRKYNETFWISSSNIEVYTKVLNIKASGLSTYFLNNSRNIMVVNL